MEEPDGAKDEPDDNNTKIAGIVWTCLADETRVLVVAQLTNAKHVFLEEIRLASAHIVHLESEHAVYVGQSDCEVVQRCMGVTRFSCR